MVFNTFLFVFATGTVGDTQMHLCHVVSTFFLFTAFLLLSAKKKHLQIMRHKGNTFCQAVCCYKI